MFFDASRKKSAAIKRYYNKRFGVRPLVESSESIEQWFASNFGKRLLSLQQQRLDQLMPEIFGYHLMQLSVLDNLALSEQSPVTHHFSLGFDSKKVSASESGMDTESQPVRTAAAISEFESLPIDEESIDAAILHHVLDYSVKPHQLLRETARTIISNGYMIIIGFNPGSPLMFKKQIGRHFRRSDHWRYNDLRKNRVVDWLRVLGFEPMLVEYGGHGLPLNRIHSKKLDKVFNYLLPTSGAFYIIVARKHIVPMTIIRKPWKKRRALPAWVKGKAAEQIKTKLEKTHKQ